MYLDFKIVRTLCRMCMLIYYEIKRFYDYARDRQFAEVKRDRQIFHCNKTVLKCTLLSQRRLSSGIRCKLLWSKNLETILLLVCAVCTMARPPALISNLNNFLQFSFSNR